MKTPPLLPEAQVLELARILMQYAPEGWRCLTLRFRVDAAQVELESWAETDALLHHGFRLDDADADAVQALLLPSWESSGRNWSSALFEVDCNGRYSLQAE